jgi:hypothetical protein
MSTPKWNPEVYEREIRKEVERVSKRSGSARLAAMVEIAASKPGRRQRFCRRRTCL